MFNQKKLLYNLCVITAFTTLSCSDNTGDSVGGKTCDACTRHKDCAEGFSCIPVNDSKLCAPKDAQCDSNGENCKQLAYYHNNVLDACLGETDVDCGYDSLCAIGQKCVSGDNCISTVCSSGKCANLTCAGNDECAELGADATCEAGVCVSCSDGVQNRNESDVDCGGSCGGCEVGKSCKSDFDCKGICEAYVCVDAPEASHEALVINEVLVAANTSKYFSENVKQCEFIEIVNVSNEAVSLKDVSITAIEVGGEKPALKTSLENVGSLGAKQGLLLFSVNGDSKGEKKCEIVYDPTEVVAFHINPGILTNTKQYEVYLTIDGEEGEHFVADKDNGISTNLKKELKSGSGFIKHDQLAGMLASPGTCANGDPLSTGCNYAAAESCTDGTKNQDETGIDCGGSECKPCAKDHACKVDSDCETAECTNGICTGEVPVMATVNDLMINEVYGKKGSSGTNKYFVYNDGASVCEFVEIINKTDKNLKLDNIQVVYERLDSSATNKAQLSGVIMANNAAVVHSCDQLPLPSGVMGVKVSDSLMADNVERYKVFLKDTTIENSVDASFGEVEVEVKNSTGISYTRATDMNESAEMKKHTEVQPNVNASPGYCANGMYFISKCADTCNNGQHDEGEMGVDCGGICSKKGCDNGVTCAKDKDCASGYCEPLSKTCKADPCSNGEKNEGEADVDCGGSCSLGCELGKKCDLDNDCNSGYCNPSTNKCELEPCFNGVKDSNESGVDCGEVCDAKCGNGDDCESADYCSSGYCNTTTGKCDDKPCTTNDDCEDSTGYCNTGNGKCEEKASCSDKIKNQDETDVDCGGATCGKCDNDKTCNVAEDCLSNQCNSVCTGEISMLNALVINEVMGAPDSNKFFAIQTETKQAEFIEIVNLANKEYSLEGVKLNLMKDVTALPAAGTTPSVTYSLSDLIIPAKGSLVLSAEGTTIPMPLDGVNKDILGTSSTKSISNTKSYVIWLSYNEVAFSAVLRTAETSNGKSQNRKVDAVVSDMNLVAHDTISSLNNSPGYCANGALFSNNCVLTVE